MSNARDFWKRQVRRFPLFMVLLPFIARAQFPSLPPDSVTFTMDRDQMLWQLGITFPSLPDKLSDPEAPRYAHPSKPSDPEGNWSDSMGHFIARTGFGLWTNYEDGSAGLFPGPDSGRVGSYTPINLLKMHDGTSVTTSGEWWGKRRPELWNDVREQLWGVIPPDSILPKVTWTVARTTGSTGDSEYIQMEITGLIDISRYPRVRNVPRISATMRVPAHAGGKVPVMIVIGSARWTPMDTYWSRCRPNGWGVCIFEAGAVQPDNGAYLTSYLIGLCNKGNWRKPTSREPWWNAACRFPAMKTRRRSTWTTMAIFTG